MALTVKLDPELAAEIRRFCERECGRPLYLGLSTFAAQAFKREMERLNLVIAGALPLDRAAGKGEPPPSTEAAPARRKPVNSSLTD